MAAPQFNPASYAASQYGLPVVSPAVSHPPSTSQSYPQQQRQPSVIAPPFPPLDASSLQHLLGRVHQQTPSTSIQQNPPPVPFPPNLFNPQQSAQGQQPLPSASDLSRLLASANAAPQNHQSQNTYSQQQAATSQPPSGTPISNQYSNLTSNPAWANLLANMPRPPTIGLPQQQQQQQPPQQGSLSYGQGPQQAARGQNFGPAPNQGQSQGAPDMSSIMAQLARYGQ